MCDEAHHGCAMVSQIEACAGKGEAEACEYTGVPDGACADGVCLPSGCGNGVIMAPEVCDDGNRFHGDGCSADCLSTEVCGNGIIDAVTGEACDDGNTSDGDACHTDCKLPTCGDGVLDAQFNEQCDMGDANSQDPGASCRKNCQAARCGDGVKDPGEVCDDGDTTSGDGCSADCLSLETCGNNYVDTALGEQCDDGNNDDQDGCQGNCKAPFCGDGIIDPLLHEDCDNGSANADVADACRTSCRMPVCGDDILDSTEVCDDGNNNSGDLCSADCQSTETCGNSYIDVLSGEACDDGDLLSHDGCRSCQTEVASWRSVDAETPNARRFHAMAYDIHRGRTVMFGGEGATISGDTWEWNGDGWTKVTPAAGSPSRRQGHAMAYDSDRRVTVLYGGTSKADTWEWDGTGWRNVATSTGPGLRQNLALAYDPIHHEVLLFGGADKGGTLFDDTWAWNGSDWIQKPPTLFASPAPRQNHAMAFDPVRGKIVLFGGDTSLGRANDTWEWDGSHWTSATPASGNPAVRSMCSLAWDAARGKVVLFGGYGGAAGYYNDAYEWDGVAWTVITPTSSAPSQRYGHAMVGDVARDQLVVFGGTSSAGFLGDTWTLSNKTWTNVSPSVTPPPGRIWGAMAYDLRRGKTVVFGGLNGNVGPLDDVWEWNGTTWSNLTPGAGSPSARYGATAAYDAGHGYVLVFGGFDTVPRNDTYAWNGSSWQNKTPGAGNPPVRARAASAYDAEHDQVILFGGAGPSQLRDDTWAWNGTTWNEVNLSGARPPARVNHALAYDAARKVVVLFGGQDINNDPLGDTWEWDGTGWAEVSSKAGPGAASDIAMAYDVARGRVILFVKNGNFNETWEWSGSTWTDISPGGSNPQQRDGHSLAYDALRRQTVLFGGGIGSYLNDTWVFQFAQPSTPQVHARPDDSCQIGYDVDGDGALGCADPDCSGACAPLCNPTLQSCATMLPRCGDTFCDTGVETKRLCPSDCGAAPVVCGDARCEAPESSQTCPGDCP